MTLVDTNVFLDLIKRDPVWMPWSVSQLQWSRDHGGLATNMVVYAELTGFPQQVVDVDQMLHDLDVRSIDLTRPAARLAGQAFRAYRERGGAKTGVLPDFFIGAHAVAQGHNLLTRDGTRYRSYFPGIALICP